MLIFGASKKGGYRKRQFLFERPALAGRGVQRKGGSVGSSEGEESKPSAQGLQLERGGHRKPTWAEVQSWN